MKKKRSKTQYVIRLSKEVKFLKVVCSKCGTLNLIPMPLMTDEPIKCEKCGKIIAEPKELIRIVKSK